MFFTTKKIIQNMASRNQERGQKEAVLKIDHQRINQAIKEIVKGK